jgi:hypothetical protein
MQQSSHRLTPVESAQQGLPVAEAAERLGVSQAAIRQRLRRGTLTSYRADGRVYVVIPDTTALTSSHPADSTSCDTADTPAVSADPAAIATENTAEAVRTAVAAVTAAYTTTIEQLTGEVAFLREELRAGQETRQREVSELHILLQRAQAQIPMPTLAAQPQEHTADQPTPQESRRRWWWPFGTLP